MTDAPKPLTREEIDRLNEACEHGHQKRKCPYCEIVELEAELARLRRYRERTRGVDSYCDDIAREEGCE